MRNTESLIKLQEIKRIEDDLFDMIERENKASLYPNCYSSNERNFIKSRITQLSQTYVRICL